MYVSWLYKEISPDVKFPPKDIRKVQELANSLLPVEEGEFLDQIDALLQSDQRYI